MDGKTEELRQLAETLDEARREIDLAREQSTKPKHLHVRARQSAVQAARAVAAAVDLGCTEIWPSGPWILSALRNPDDPNREPATIAIGNRTGKCRSIRIGSGCDPDGKLREDTALALWVQQICPVLRSKQAALRGGAGGFDFPVVKTDDQGHVVGRNGKPLPVNETYHESGQVAAEKLDGEPATLLDDYDAADAMEHLRCQAADWADACRVAVELIRPVGPRTEPMTHQDVADYFKCGKNEVRQKVLQKRWHEYEGRKVVMQVKDMPPLYHRVIKDRAEKMV